MIKEKIKQDMVLTELRNLNNAEGIREGKGNGREYFEETQTARILKGMDIIKNAIQKKSWIRRRLIGMNMVTDLPLRDV